MSGVCCTKTAFVKKNVAYVQHFYYFCTVKLDTLWRLFDSHKEETVQSTLQTTPLLYIVK